MVYRETVPFRRQGYTRLLVERRFCFFFVICRARCIIAKALNVELLSLGHNRLAER